MRCTNCGRENPYGAIRCIYCNTPLYEVNAGKNDISVKDGISSKKASTVLVISIIALTIVLAILVGAYAVVNLSPATGFGGGGGGGARGVVYTPDFNNTDPAAVMDRLKELNGGVMPEITYDDEGIPSFIDGKYSNLKVTDYETAILSLQDLQGIMKFSNVRKEYIGYETYEIDGSRFIKLQQMLNQIPVYNKQLIVTTDNIGNIKCLSCDYDANLVISNVQTMEKHAAEDKVKNLTGFGNVYSCELFVYTLADSPVLAWVADVGNDVDPMSRIIISAEDGSEIERFDLRYESVEATAFDMKGEKRTFNVAEENGQYVMKNEEYGIEVYECNNTDTLRLVTSSNNIWNDPAAVSAMANLGKVIYYYTDVFKTSAFDNGKLETIQVRVNYKPSDCESDKYYNAYSSTSGDATRTTIAFGAGYNYSKSFDVAGHEFTHSVVKATCDLVYLNQSGAINEAYADIIANLIQNDVYGQDEWEHAEEKDGGANRNLKNPNAHSQPDKINGQYMHAYCYEFHDHGDAGCDNGGVHTNSGIINHAAYLMYKNGLTNKKELGTLFVRSLEYMVPTTTFVGCRSAVVRAARDMGMDSSKVGMITKAFDAVGIVNMPIPPAPGEQVQDPEQVDKTICGTLAGRVADADSSNPIADAEIKATRVEQPPVFAGSVFSDPSGNFTAMLNPGIYKLTIGANGYLPCTIDNIEVVTKETTYIENTILLTEIEGNPLSQAGGKVTDAISGDVISGVKLKFRNGWGSTYGDFVKNVNNTDIEIYTNDNGVYYTAELPYGYYTAEVTIDGYTTQHVNIVASNNTDISLSQDIVLSPEAVGNKFIITLEWADNPRDEDAHIVGDVPGDFHVYFSRKQASFDGETVAKLDHDDTRGNGFETITLDADPNGTYRYFVHHYAGSGNLATSNAVVKVYQGNVMVKKYNVPVDQGNGIYWNVFEIKNGQIVTINQISDTWQE